MIKVLTATGVTALIDEGTAKIDDPVGKNLPEPKAQMAAGKQADGTV